MWGERRRSFGRSGCGRRERAAVVDSKRPCRLKEFCGAFAVEKWDVVEVKGEETSGWRDVDVRMEMDRENGGG